MTKYLGLNNKIFQFFYSAILYVVVDRYTGYFFLLPEDSFLGLGGFIPSFLGIIWGPVAAFGSFFGAIFDEYEDFLILPEILAEEGWQSFLWNAVLLICNCGFWAFISAYMPWRLFYSLFVDSKRQVFSLHFMTILKFVWIMFLTHLTTSLFLAMTTSEEDILKLLKGLDINLSISAEYALTNFFNDFDSSIFVGMMLFFFMKSSDYKFSVPQGNIKPRPHLQTLFDLIFVFAVVLSLTLCQPQMIDREGTKFFAAILLCSYMFRPFSPVPKITLNRHEKIINQDDIRVSRKIAVLFYIFFIALYLVLDLSGTIYGMDNMNTWRQFNAECITMMNISLVALLCMLLRYHRSIMTSIVMLEVITVFIASFALGAVGFWVVDRLTIQNTENSLSEMSVVCRERLEKTFTHIRFSVNDIKDLALAELESYERITQDATWRENYLRRTEQLFRAIATNTDGSVAFYMRLAPEYAGPLGGFSWGRDESKGWEGNVAGFYRRTPIDLSKYSPDDVENVGWYYIPVERKKSTWIEPYVDPTVHAYVISYVSPFYLDDKLIGVVGMDIDFDFLIHEVRRLSVYEYGFAYLIDRNGHVLYHKDFKQGEIFQHNPKYRELETYLANGIWIGISMPLEDVYAERNDLLMHIVSVMLIVTILVSFFSIYLASRGVRPLLILTEATQKIASGNLNVKLPTESSNELGTLVKSIREMVAKLEIYVYRDKLTGLSNTTAYARKCAELAENVFPYAVVVFDVNFLKKINDTYGHESGNELIKTAANILAETFPNSNVFRIGGDEFVAILEEADFVNRDDLLAEFDKTSTERFITVQNDEKFYLSIARGMSVWVEGMEYAEVFQKADENMYAHKTEIKKALGVEMR